MSKDQNCWHKQKHSDQFELIPCKPYDTYADYQADPSGYYVLVRPNFEFLKIEVAICSADHKIEKAFQGQTCQELYHAIFDYEEKQGCVWFSDKKHVAYLGKELKKAEMALYSGNNAYFQE